MGVPASSCTVFPIRNRITQYVTAKGPLTSAAALLPWTLFYNILVVYQEAQSLVHKGGYMGDLKKMEYMGIFVGILSFVNYTYELNQAITMWSFLLLVFICSVGILRYYLQYKFIHSNFEKKQLIFITLRSLHILHAWE